MKICVFYKYNVKYHADYSIYDAEYDNFRDKTLDKEYIVMDGGELVERLQRHMQDKDFIAIKTKELEDGITEEIYIENFDPTSGESADYRYTIKALSEAEVKGEVVK